MPKHYENGKVYDLTPKLQARKPRATRAAKKRGRELTDVTSRRIVAT